MVQEQADTGCFTGVGIRGTPAPKQMSLPYLGREGWHLLLATSSLWKLLPPPLPGEQ